MREKLKITRALVAVGYYPCIIRLRSCGNVRIVTREAYESDKELIEREEKELAEVISQLKRAAP
jgi:hypothetical protein